jgi:hypothetical protein
MPFYLAQLDQSSSLLSGLSEYKTGLTYSFLSAMSASVAGCSLGVSACHLPISLSYCLADFMSTAFTYDQVEISVESKRSLKKDCQNVLTCLFWPCLANYSEILYVGMPKEPISASKLTPKSNSEVFYFVYFSETGNQGDSVTLGNSEFLLVTKELETASFIAKQLNKYNITNPEDLEKFCDDIKLIMGLTNNDVPTHNKCD